jgi:Holliday junction resolvase RusA-like endonuclease
MTRGDKWNNRQCVVNYWNYKYKIQEQFSGKELPENYLLVFYLPMPKSWSQKKKNEKRHTPHTCRPDKDNLEKGFLDALYSEDSQIWDGRVIKLWGDRGRIDVYQIDSILAEFS